MRLSERTLDVLAEVILGETTAARIAVVLHSTTIRAARSLQWLRRKGLVELSPEPGRHYLPTRAAFELAATWLPWD